MKEIFSTSNYFFNIHSLIYLFSGLLILAEAVFIFSQNRRSMLNIGFFLCNFFAGIWLTGIAIIYSCLNEQLAVAWSRYYCWLGIIFVTPSVYLLSAAWKDISLAKSRKIVYFNFVSAFLIYLVCISSNYIVRGVWAYSWGFYPKAGSGEIFLIIWFYALMILSFRNFIRSYKEETVPIRKKQAKLVTIAFVLGFLGSLDFLANYPIPLYPFGGALVLLFSTVVAYNIVNYKLMDIETVLHKTALWVLSYSLIAAPIFFLYNGLSEQIESSNLLLFIFWTASFLAVTVYLRLIQPKIDHFFQRRKANLEEISTEFTKDLVHLRGLSQLVKHIKETIVEALYSQNVDIAVYTQDDKSYQGQPFLLWLAKNDKIAHRDFIEIDPAYASIKEEARKYFNSVKAVVVIPLVLNERLLGVINLAKKSNLKRYAAVDFNFLSLLKNQSAIAISNSLVYENIEEQVKKRTAELIDVQNQLTQAAKLATVGTLAGGVAHEINNPLAAILTNVQMLLASFDEMDIEETKESLEMIEEATKRCRIIVRKLMTYARKPLESSAIARINLLDVVKKVEAFLGYQLNQENIKLDTQAQDDTYFVMGNQNELEQVVINIVLNAKDAIKRINKNGTIDISLTKNDDWVRLDIKDEGSGITQDQIPKIFDPFFTTKDVGEGLGLGLSISQSIIEKYKGSIFLKANDGEGTIFTVNLPYAG